MNRRALASLALLGLAAACSHKVDGPTPSVSGVAPAAVCQAQLDTSVKLSGAGLSPLVTGALDKAQLDLPTVTLARVEDVAGKAAAGSVQIPDDPANPSASHVRWVSQTQMSFDVFPALKLPTGLYDVDVQDADGKKGAFPAGLLAVPPPALTKIGPDLLCGDKQNTLELDGDFFIESATAKPKIYFDKVAFDPATMDGCRKLPGASGLQACTKMTVSLPSGSLADGVHAVSVLNPDPVGCTSSDKVNLTIVPDPTLATIVPDLACDAQGTTSLTLSGTGFLTVDGAAPRVTISDGTNTVTLDTTASSCTPVTGPSETVQTCTTLAATLPQSALPPGNYQTVVQNPPPADCVSSQAVDFTVAPEPVVTAVVPDIACAADGSVPVEIDGTGFLTVNGALPTVTVGSLALTPAASGCTALTGPLETVQECTALTVSVPQGTAAGSLAVSVTNPAPAGCTSAAGPALTLFDAPVVTAVKPAEICEAAASALSLEIDGSGFTTVSGAAPSVQIGAQTFTSAASGCTAVTGTTEPVQLCTVLTVSIPTGTFTQTGQLPLTVTNPGPIGCVSSGSATVTVTPPPTLASVVPAQICSGGATLVLSGTGFEQGALVTMGAVKATSVTVDPAGTSATAVFPGGLPVGGPYDVTLANPDGCSATLPASEKVIPGPEIFFVDPSVAYNGISIQATVYGTGFTGAVQSVSITPSGGGAATSLVFTYDAAKANQVQVVIPAGLAPGSYDMDLNDTTTCTAHLASAITVVDQTTLTLTAITPPFGWTSGTTAVTVNASTTAPSPGFLAVPRIYLNPTNPGPGAIATALGALSFQDATTVNGLVPSGLPAAFYDVIAVNPDGTVGVLTNAFQVTAQPPPDITGLSPGSLPTGSAQSFTILGDNFRVPAVALTCVDINGVSVTAPAVTVGAFSATTISASVNAAAGVAACVVRVTDTDNSTWADYSALAFSNPAQNLSTTKPGPDLSVGRRAPVALGGDATTAARFLHVIGGDDGAGNAFDSVESSQLTLLGAPQPFATQRNHLNQARAFAGGALIGRWLYVAGGSDKGTAFDTVERSYVLNPADREEITDLYVQVMEGAGLGPGLWYYRVAAVKDANDPFNPGGENLPSDPFPVQLPNVGMSFTVTLYWQTQPNVGTYRIYRSPVAGATVGTEELIGEVPASQTSFTDNGLTPIATTTPLPIGSLGLWQTLTPRLTVPREGPGVSWAVDPSAPGTAYLYVIGGRQNATTAQGDYDYLPITLNADGSQSITAAAFSNDAANTISARWQLGASNATAQLSSRIPSGDTYVYALSGVNAAGAMVTAADAALVQAGGKLGAWTALSTLSHAGYATMVAGNFVYAFGGLNAGPDTGIVSGEICGSGVLACGPPAAQVPPKVVNWNAGAAMGTPRYLMGGTLSSAFIYIAGGETAAGAPPTLTNSTEYFIW